jgi:GNAT superfamily N-acetyltransferase
MARSLVISTANDVPKETERYHFSAMPSSNHFARRYHFREAEASDEPLLREMVYLAVYVPPGHDPPPRAILDLPEVARYARGWGRDGDLGIVAVDLDTGEGIGAAWLRLWSDQEHGYGFTDVDTPELTIALLPEFRGRGIGTQLLQHLLVRADERFARVSLSVTLGNPAARLYERLGFKFVRTPLPPRATSLTMVRKRRERQ